MDSVKILHCADIHIGASEQGLGAGYEARRFDALITFEKIIELAQENGVQIFLIAGDLFHSNNIEPTFFEKVFDAIALASDIKFVFSAGNHDPINSESPFVKYKLPDNLFVLESKDSFFDFPKLNTRVYGKSFKEVYLKGEKEFSIKPNENYINIMCIHGELKSDLGSNYNSITSSFIENSGMDYIALGHVHKKTEIGKIGKSYCAYSGCPEGQGFDELGEKGVYIGDVGKDICNLEFIPTAKRMHICESVDITALQSNAEIAEKILDTLKEKFGDTYAENLYKIILTGQTDEVVEVSTAEILSRISDNLYFIKINDRSETAFDYSAIANEKSLKGIFVKKMLARLDAATESEKPLIKSALNLGLKAFNSEVSFDEN